MKRKLIFVVGLSILLTGLPVLANASGSQAIESSSLKTVMLRIEGMT